MRLIDADAVFDWYIKEFSEEHLGDNAIKPNECRFSMYDIKGNLDNIPTVCDIAAIRAEIEEWATDPCVMNHGCGDEVLRIIDKYTKGGNDG